MTAEELSQLITNAATSAVQTFIDAQKRADEYNEFMTRREVADLLGISLPTLYKYTKDGIFQSYKLGSLIRYKRSEVEAVRVANRKDWKL